MSDKIDKLDVKIDKVVDKVEKVKEEVDELKVDFRIHSEKMCLKLDVFEAHMTGDKKIISDLQPVLQKLPTIVEIAEQYQFEKKLKEEKRISLRKNSLRATFISLLVGIGVGLTKLISFLR